MNEEEQRISPVKLEWTNREQTELLSKLDSSDGDGIAARDFQILFKCCKKCMQVGARPAMKRHIRLKFDNFNVEWKEEEARLPGMLSDPSQLPQYYSSHIGVGAATRFFEPKLSSGPRFGIVTVGGSEMRRFEVLMVQI
ncbi:hypothetical protein DFH29DRAFT_873565 [Suillus ampliporus]|nr:hypothetical protein DFH29DRAFT_873565 [Suillus ampliporus]